MKKMVLVTMLVLGMMGSVLAETNSVGVTNATPVMNVGEMFTALKAKEATGWGAQIAYAMKGTVSALTDGMSVTTDQIYKFSESGLGKITIGIIVYNIIGKEILRFLIGIPLLIFLCWGVKRWFRYYLGVYTDADGERHSIFKDMWDDSTDGAFGAVIILIFSTFGIMAGVGMVLSWMF